MNLNTNINFGTNFLNPQKAKLNEKLGDNFNKVTNVIKHQLENNSHTDESLTISYNGGGFRSLTGEDLEEYNEPSISLNLHKKGSADLLTRDLGSKEEFKKLSKDQQYDKIMSSYGEMQLLMNMIKQ